MAGTERGELNPDGHYSTATVAKETGYSDSRIRQMCRAGLIKAIKVPGKWLIPESEVNRIRAGVKPLPPADFSVVYQVREASTHQQRAYAMHEQWDHSWLQDSRLEGHVFETETIDGPNFWDVWIVAPDLTYFDKPVDIESKAERLPIPRQTRRCPWCKVFMWRDMDFIPKTPLERVDHILGSTVTTWIQSEAPG